MLDLETHNSKRSWFSRLRDGLERSSSRLSEGIAAIITKRRLDDDMLEALEELLVSADLGPATAAKLVDGLCKTRFGKDVTAAEVRGYLAGEIAALLEPVARPLEIRADAKPFVIVVAGVNGAGKTTTIGKLAFQFQAEGRRVMLAACDTFRAAAVEQLKVWGERHGVPVMVKPQGSDAAALAYEALERAKAEGFDILMVDTAGRLHNRADLMDELAKIIRVLKKVDENAPHATLLVLDATVGQNAHAQVEAFRKVADVTGLVVTKLDGTAKGGVLVALAEKHKLPVHAIGVGETAEDLRPFEAGVFARSLLDVEALS